jgi:C-terminal processing protease CtpA/Prc
MGLASVVLTSLGAIGCAGNPPRGTIGAVLLRKSDGRVYVRDVPEHLSAYRAGIRAGDELLLIDGQDVRRFTDDDLRRSLSGLVGEPVKLTLARGDEVLRVTVKRSMAEPYRLE